MTAAATNLPVTSAPPRAHLAYLDSLRGLAALYVTVHHMMLTVWPGPVPFPGIQLLLAGAFRYGHYAVGLFIVLSGFSLMLPVARNDGQMRETAGRFYFKRCRRILPPYYACLLLSLLACWTVLGHKTGTHWDVCLPVTREGIVTHLVMLQDIFSAPQINHALWSISVEWRIYFLFPLLVLWFRRGGGLFVAVAMWLLSAAGYLLMRHTIFLDMMPAYFWLFTLGMLAAEISYGRLTALRDRVPWPLALLPVFLVFGFLLYKWRMEISYSGEFILDCLTGILSAGLLIVASQPGALQRLLSVRPLMCVGAFAYSIYLVHAPIVQLVWQLAVQPFHRSLLAGYLVLVGVGLPVILAASYAFFLAFERPFLNARSQNKNSQQFTENP